MHLNKCNGDKSNIVMGQIELKIAP